MNKRGFTLMEVIVATALFSMVVVGMLTVFVTGNKQIIRSRERLVSSELGKLFIDPMQAHVLQDTWDADLASNALYIPASPVNSFTSYCDLDAGHTALQNPACPPCLSAPGNCERRINNREFSTQYDVSRVLDPLGADTGMRRVTTTIKWNEPPS